MVARLMVNARYKTGDHTGINHALLNTKHGLVFDSVGDNEKPPATIAPYQSSTSEHPDKSKFEHKIKIIVEE